MTKKGKNSWKMSKEKILTKRVKIWRAIYEKSLSNNRSCEDGRRLNKKEITNELILMFHEKIWFRKMKFDAL